MRPLTKSSLTLVSILLLSTCLTTGSSLSTNDAGELTSTLEDGQWVNNTLVVNGTTTFEPQNAKWILFDIDDLYGEWSVLRSGEFFSEVSPVDLGVWNWSITIDVQGLECTCWLEVSQPDGLQRAILNRIVFIGNGPHDPILSPKHDSSIILDEPVLISTLGLLSEGSLAESNIILSWCHAPNGACDEDIFSTEVNATWSIQDGQNIGSFLIDADELELYDGTWEFTYILQDKFLRKSPHVSVRVFVDQTNPESILISPSKASEGDTIIIDGSDSRDGVWSSNLQGVWYINQPDGSMRVADQSETNGLVLTLNPTQSGNYSVQLNVLDMVGRMSSSQVTIEVENIDPILEIFLDGNEDNNPNSIQLLEDDNLKLSAIAHETGNDYETLVYEWYLNDKFISNDKIIEVSKLDVGTHELRLVITDDNGATDSHEMDIIVDADSNVDDKEINFLAILLIVVILGGIVLISKRMRLSENETSSMPKWNQSPKFESSEVRDSDMNGSDLWDDSNASVGGKD